MPARGAAQAPSELSLVGAEGKQRDCPFDSLASLPDTHLRLCHELAESLTAVGNYLGAVQRLVEIGHRRGQPSPTELLEKAGSRSLAPEKPCTTFAGC